MIIFFNFIKEVFELIETVFYYELYNKNFFFHKEEYKVIMTFLINFFVCTVCLKLIYVVILVNEKKL